MMIQNKSNILKTFQGQKIDESVHVARWATTINNNNMNQESSKNIFMKYAAGSSNNTIPQNQSDIIRNQNIYQTQQSQVHQIDTGFKKLKNNQISMLKQLKQQYQVLRTLNIQSQNNIKPSNNINSSNSSSLHKNNSNSQILSQSSNKNINNNIINNNTNNKKKLPQQRQTQILLLQKRQLQMIINNSMKKIQQLLHTQMQYKREIHQLKIQCNNRQNTDIQYESMLKTLKKNELNTYDMMESLKKQNQKIRLNMKNLNQKINKLQSQILIKQGQIRKIYQQKRKSQDLIRIQKDRYFNIEIDYKKIRMQYQLLQKDKDSQIKRLNKQLQFKQSNKIKQVNNQLKRYQDEIEIKDRRYGLLLIQLEQLKHKNMILQNQYQNLKNIQQAHILDKDHIEQLLTNFRDQNDSSSFNKNINQVLQRLHEIQNHQNHELKQQVQQLKDVILSLKNINQQQAQNNINFQLYQRKIQELQNQLKVQINQKQNYYHEIRRIKTQNQDQNRKINQYNTQIQQYQQIQNKLRQQIRNQRTKRQSNIKIDDSIHKNQLFNHIQNNQNNQLSAKNNELSAQNRYNYLQQQFKKQKRRAQQNQFKVTKISNQLNSKLKIRQNEHNSIVSRMSEDYDRLKRDNFFIKQQYQKYKQSRQQKILIKQKQIKQLKSEYRNNNEHGYTNINNIKLQYQTLLKNQRQRYRFQIQKLTDQITSLTKINQKYMLQTNKQIQNQNQLNLLKDFIRKNIHLSQTVNHLWKIKQTEYQNINQILKQISKTCQY